MSSAFSFFFFGQSLDMCPRTPSRSTWLGSGSYRAPARARAAAAIIIVVVSIASMAAVQNRFDDLEYIKISWRGFDLVVRNRFEDLG